MEIKFYLQVLSIAFNIGIAVSVLLNILLINGYKPSAFVIVAVAFCWVSMIKNNEVWHELLDKWGWRKRK